MRLQIVDPEYFGLIQERETNSLEKGGILYQIYLAMREFDNYAGIFPLGMHVVYDNAICNNTKICFEEDPKVLLVNHDNEEEDDFVYVTYFFTVKGNTSEVFCFAYEDEESRDNPTIFGKLVY